MDPIKIEMTPMMREHLERRVRETGVGSIADYIVTLVEADLDRGDPELERLLLQGVNSGTPIEADDAFWARLRSQAVEPVRKAAQ